MRLPLDELTNYLDGAEKQVKTWAQDTTSSASERRKKHSATVQASEASISELKLRRAAYEKQAQELQQRLQQEQAAEADELAQLRSVQAENALIPAQLQGLQQLVDRESASLEQSEAEIEAQAAEADARLAAVRVELERFRSHLGLHFAYDQESAELRLIFTYISPIDWSKPYHVTVRVLASSEYEVTACEPSLENLDSLTKELNATQNFSKFVRLVRSGFVQLS